MSPNPARVRATPFHIRTAEANESNDWQARNGFTLARSYAGSDDEALAGRFRAGALDLSWRWQLAIEGPRAAEFAMRLATGDAMRLAPGEAMKALWLGDGGAVRGAGVFARFGRECLHLIAAAEDRHWIEQAAARFDVTVREMTQSRAGLGLVGPYAAATLSRAGLPADLDLLTFRRQFWRGLDITLSRFGEQGGYELWCGADDAVILWDRILTAGEPFGIEPIGLAAADILDLEAGIARPERDYPPYCDDPLQRDGEAAARTPLAWGLESLIAETNTGFNGRNAWIAARGREPLRLIGIEIDAQTAAPFTPLARDGRTVGHTLSSVVSPALRRAIALAQVDREAAAPGTEFALTLPPSMETPELRPATARAVELPFLPPPGQIAP